jgi:hypothetical protein
MVLPVITGRNPVAVAVEKQFSTSLACHFRCRTTSIHRLVARYQFHWECWIISLAGRFVCDNTIHSGQRMRHAYHWEWCMISLVSQSPCGVVSGRLRKSRFGSHWEQDTTSLVWWSTCGVTMKDRQMTMVGFRWRTTQHLSGMEISMWYYHWRTVYNKVRLPLRNAWHLTDTMKSIVPVSSMMDGVQGIVTSEEQHSISLVWPFWCGSIVSDRLLTRPGCHWRRIQYPNGVVLSMCYYH